MGKRQELELEAIRRYADGMEIPAISEALGVSENSLRDWKKRAGTEWQDARTSARQSQLVSMEDVGSRLRRSREIASQLMGSSRDQGAVGMVLNQTLQTMLYDLMNQMDTAAIDPDELGKVSKLLNNISLALGRTEQAASINTKREREIRKDEREKAAETATEIARQAGVSPDTVDKIWKEVLRMS
jgi:DNA-binding transcriptional regulator YiaG